MNIVKDHCKNFKRYGEKRSAPLDSIQVHSIGDRPEQRESSAGFHGSV